jgi:hypothetical protein
VKALAGVLGHSVTNGNRVVGDEGKRWKRDIPTVEVTLEGLQETIRRS